MEEERAAFGSREKDLILKIDTVQKELDIIKNLRSDQDDGSSTLLGSEDDDFSRIDTNPKEAALHYLRLMKSIKKEYKILQNSQEQI